MTAMVVVLVDRYGERARLLAVECVLVSGVERMNLTREEGILLRVGNLARKMVVVGSV